MSDRIYKTRVVWGRPGLNTGFVTNPELVAAIADRAPSNASFLVRVAEPGLSNETALSSMGPGLIKIGDHDGAVSVAVGADLPPHNHAGVPFSLPLPLDGGGAAITSGIKWIDIYVPFAATITGWEIGTATSSTVTCTVLRALAATPTVYAAISGSEKPLLNGALTNSDFTLTSWSTSLAAGDRLRVDVDGSPTPTLVLGTLNLLMTRSI